MAKAKTSITTENHSGSAADAAAKEQRTEMPLSDLHPFEGHPFKVLDDELMEQTVESIKQIGRATDFIFHIPYSLSMSCKIKISHYFFSQYSLLAEHFRTTPSGNRS